MVLDHLVVGAHQGAQLGELAGRLEHRLVDVAHTQPLGQVVGVQLVALGTATLLVLPQDHHPAYMWTENLVQPVAVRALFEAQVATTRHQRDGLDQRLAVGLQYEISDPFPCWPDNGQSAA